MNSMLLNENKKGAGLTRPAPIQNGGYNDQIGIIIAIPGFEPGWN